MLLPFNTDPRVLGEALLILSTLKLLRSRDPDLHPSALSQSTALGLCLLYLFRNPILSHFPPVLEALERGLTSPYWVQ